MTDMYVFIHYGYLSLVTLTGVQHRMNKANEANRFICTCSLWTL